MEEDQRQRLEHLHTRMIEMLKNPLKCKEPITLTVENMIDLCEFFDEVLYN